MAEHNFEYDFVISYAGEDTSVAEKLSELLEERGATVFYAPDRAAQTWGENLYTFLAEIYSKKGLYCIPLISQKYVEKQWTKHEWRSAQERALRDQDKAYILPIRLDDSPLPGLLQTVGYIDLNTKTIEEIAEIAIDKLRLFKDNVQLEIARKPIEDKAWEYVGVPNQRNQYLRKNNYLDRTTDNFAENSLTAKLYNRSTKEQATNFCTFIALTHPDSIFWDIETIIEKLDFESRDTNLNLSNPNWEWQKFHFQKLYQIENMQEQIVRINPEQFEHSLGSLSFFAINQFGTIEFATGNDCNHSFSNYSNPEETKTLFHLVAIIGLLWKFLNVCAHIYNRLDYYEQIQLIINLKNTENTILSGFANANSEGKRWVSRTSNHFEDRLRFENTNQGISFEKNIQLVYELNISAMKDEMTLSTELINHFSRKIQRSFNYPNPPTRHYVPDTSEFPWRQFYQYTVS